MIAITWPPGAHFGRANARQGNAHHGPGHLTQQSTEVATFAGQYLNWP
jgi:hypothetical protein